MTVSRRFPMRDATPDDLPAIGALHESVGWGVNEWALRTVIGQPFVPFRFSLDLMTDYGTPLLLDWSASADTLGLNAMRLMHG